jgi:hypothetical protein
MVAIEDLEDYLVLFLIQDSHVDCEIELGLDVVQGGERKCI